MIFNILYCILNHQALDAVAEVEVPSALAPLSDPIPPKKLYIKANIINPPSNSIINVTQLGEIVGGDFLASSSIPSIASH